MTTPLPDISLIIPLLNEAGELPGLMDSITEQRGVTVEVLLCDGGSDDGTQQLCRALSDRPESTVRVISTTRGRGRQMNAGALAARSGLLLFLHADSRFDGPDALCSAVSAYQAVVSGSTAHPAARFALRFRRRSPEASLAYFFYESKARLNRADCIRGDQGFMLTRELFHALGGFDSSLPFLEDVRLAERIAVTSRWLLLPAVISTSARRFETEGLYERQVVNAIITNAVAADWEGFFTALPGIYRCRADGRLELYPLLTGIQSLLAAASPEWRRDFWRSTGHHVAGNVWQLFFWLDVRRAFRNVGTGPEPALCWLPRFERLLGGVTRLSLFQAVTATVVKIWFLAMLIRHRPAKETS